MNNVDKPLNKFGEPIKGVGPDELVDSVEMNGQTGYEALEELYTLMPGVNWGDWLKNRGRGFPRLQRKLAPA